MVLVVRSRVDQKTDLIQLEQPVQLAFLLEEFEQLTVALQFRLTLLDDLQVRIVHEQAVVQRRDLTVLAVNGQPLKVVDAAEGVGIDGGQRIGGQGQLPEFRHVLEGVLVETFDEIRAEIDVIDRVRLQPFDGFQLVVLEENVLEFLQLTQRGNQRLTVEDVGQMPEKEPFERAEILNRQQTSLMRVGQTQIGEMLADGRDGRVPVVVQVNVDQFQPVEFRQLLKEQLEIELRVGRRVRIVHVLERERFERLKRVRAEEILQGFGERVHGDVLEVELLEMVDVRERALGDVNETAVPNAKDVDVQVREELLAEMQIFETRFEFDHAIVNVGEQRRIDRRGEAFE